MVCVKEYIIFYEKFKDELTSAKRWFIQSKVDACVFHRKDIISLCCVDDCLMFARYQKLIDKLIMSLKECFLCADEGEADGCLGVEIKSKDGLMT